MAEHYLYFIRLIGQEDGGYYRYEFFFTDDIDNVQVEDFDYKPCCLTQGIKPIQQENDMVQVVKAKIKLALIQDNCCFSFKNCMDGVVALAYEDITDYEEYPQEGRLVFHFGEEYDGIERKLAAKNILML